MKAIKLFGIIFLLSMISVSCKKTDDSSNVNCDQLKVGLINKDSEILKTEIAQLVKDLSPLPTATDAIGHKNNLDLLVTRLNECDQIRAEFLCYACIKTLPAQSEIIIHVDSANISISRILYLTTPENAKLSFASLTGNY